MSTKLTMDITFPMDGSKPTIRSTVRRERWSEFVEEYLRAQIGAGADPAPAEERKVYQITIAIDLEDDGTYSKHDCGNKGLRDGILMSLLKDIAENAVIDASDPEHTT